MTWYSAKEDPPQTFLSTRALPDN